MALQTLAAPLYWPGNALQINNAPAVSALDAVDSGHYGAYIFSAPQDMTITHLWLCCQAVAGSPTVECRVETVSAGAASGTLWNTLNGGSTGTSGTLTAGSSTLVALTASAVVTKSQNVAIVYKYASGTTFTTQTLATTTNFTSGLPYRATNKTGSVVKADSNSIAFAVGTSSTTFIPLAGIRPVLSLGGGTFNNTNSAARAALFTPPFKCRIIGCRIYIAGSTGDYKVGIYTGDASGTEISNSETSFTGTFQSGNVSCREMYFDNVVTPTVGTAYRLAVTPSSATNVSFSTMVLPSSAYLTAMPGGSNFYYSSLASSVWTDDATQVPFVDLIIDQLDDGVQVAGSTARIIGG